MLGKSATALRLAAAVTMSSVLGLTACGGGSGSTPSATGTPVKGGTILYAHQQEPACVFGGWIEQAYISANVLDSLTSLDASAKAVPWLADSWETSSDNLTWTFHLKKGVTFTDGTELTGAVVAYNFDYWVNKGGNGTALAWLGGYYKSAEAVDATTVKVQLLRPYPRLAETVSQGYFGIQSQKSIESRAKEQICEKPVGTGAFTVDSWQRGQQITLVRNDRYASWPANAKHRGPAIVDKVIWKFVADPTTRVSALKTSQVNAIYDVPAVAWKPLQDAGFPEQKYVTKGRPQQITFNTAHGVFTDEKVRQAFAYSLDRKKIVETIGQGLIPFEGNGPVSQATPGYSHKAADWYHLDLAKANQLLDAAGWTGRDGEGYRTKGGQTLQALLPYAAGSIINADGATILQAVQEKVKATGFKLKLVPVSRAELAAGKFSKPDDHELTVGYWTAVTAGILYVNWRPSTPQSKNNSNSAFHNDPVLEKFILDGNSALDLNEQNAFYVKAQDYIAEHALSIGLYDRLSTLAVQPTLKDVWQEHSQGGPVFHDAYFIK